MRLFPKTGTGNLGVAIAAFAAFLFAAGQKAPDWVGCVCGVVFLANALQALWRAAMRLCGERPDQKAARARFEHFSSLSFEFRVKRR